MSFQHSQSDTRLKLIIIMGVSGCGKSSVGSKIAHDLAYRFIEADDFHSAESKRHMAAGKPLTDAMREPWLQRLSDKITSEPLQNTVMAYSGLRRHHRQRFRNLGFNTLFIHLYGEQKVIERRMQQRVDHFMPISLLTSQYAALELPHAEPDVVTLDIGIDFQHIMERVHAVVRLTQPVALA
ncbi:MAG: gluconokinase [Paraglaciecola sp.]|uniref:gluconokinase n=1 Tax=Paraglaciecola sp. TaxID=1920173 RepID=UPI00273DF1D8|nr:gluconokinase [Paraglaciecola sp.]MDP5030228.1 gluconokinase [Paraglaciecola sp.]MDP5131389.1 gluconokinase [Paraglaciecola sp.]